MKQPLLVFTAALALSTASYTHRFLFGSPRKFIIENPGATGPTEMHKIRTSPGEIRVFHLHDLAKFEKAPFRDLEEDRYKTTLGDDVARDMRKGGVLDIPKFGFEIDPATLRTVKYVGLVWVYPKPDGTVSRERAWMYRDELDYSTYVIKGDRLVVARIEQGVHLLWTSDTLRRRDLATPYVLEIL